MGAEAKVEVGIEAGAASWATAATRERRAGGTTRAGTAAYPVPKAIQPAAPSSVRVGATTNGPQERPSGVSMLHTPWYAPIREAGASSYECPARIWKATAGTTLTRSSAGAAHAGASAGPVTHSGTATSRSSQWRIRSPFRRASPRWRRSRRTPAEPPPALRRGWRRSWRPRHPGVDRRTGPPPGRHPERGLAAPLGALGRGPGDAGAGGAGGAVRPERPGGAAGARGPVVPAELSPPHPASRIPHPAHVTPLGPPRPFADRGPAGQDPP